jgi:hypothetical protein
MSPAGCLNKPQQFNPRYIARFVPQNLLLGCLQVAPKAAEQRQQSQNAAL